MPNSMALEPNNLLLIVSGFDPVLRWDGWGSSAEPAGVLPPATALAMAGSGAGNIVGRYFAFERFVDQYGNFSNFSPVSLPFDAIGPTGAIVDASADTPIIITTAAAHGLTTGVLVKIAGLTINTSAVNTWTITVLSATKFSLNGSSGQFDDAAGGGTWTAGVGTVTYTAVPIPIEPKVRRRQILRNTDGQANVFYVDVDTTDLSSSTFTSTKLDTELVTQLSQAFLDTAGRNIANVFTPPPNWKQYLAFHQDRMFYAGEEAYAEGNISVTFGSATVTGIATEWGIALQTRLLYVDGASQPYTILAVDVVLQTLTLSAPYLGPTSTYAFYAIRPEPGQRRLVYFSEAGLPEAVPAFNALALQEDNDDITGLLVFRSFLYILESRHLYKLSFSTGPLEDGGVFLASLRGCVSDRCAIVVNDKAYMLDEQGVHAFGGSQQDEPISGPIQGLFRQEAAAHYQINWSARRFFHANLYPTQEVIRWFVCFSGDYLPRHALCFAYRMNRWWVEEYAVPIGASCLGRAGQSANTWKARGEQVYLGSSARQVFGFWKQFLDGADPSGSTRGTATAATLFTLTDAGAHFKVTAGVPVSIVSGRGKEQTRMIASATATQLTVASPWNILPDATSVYQVGGIPWAFITGWFDYSPSEPNNVRAVDVEFIPTTKPAEMTMRRFSDYKNDPDQMGFTFSRDQDQGIETTKGSGDLVADLTKPLGFVRKRLDGRNESEADGNKFFQLELTGVGGDCPTTILNIGLDGATQ